MALMAHDTKALRDPARWTVTLLPLPKRQTRATAFGLCGGFAVGYSEGRGAQAAPQWWPEGQPAALTVPGQKWLSMGRARGREMAGWWLKGDGSARGAVGWRLDAGGRLVLVDLHDPARYASTMALGAGGGCFVGMGEPKVKKGERAPERPLLWRADNTLVELPTPPGEEAQAVATDGAWVVGRQGRIGRQQAALWKIGGGELVSLGAPNSISEAYGVRDGEQVGTRWVIERAGTRSVSTRGSAALWRGDAASFVDLTPKGNERAHADDCAQGYQVGYCQAKLDTRGGFASMATRATLWAGTAASHVDLHAFVPAPWNASTADAIEVSDGRLRIVGEASQFSVRGELTKQEEHLIVAQVPIVWEAQLP